VDRQDGLTDNSWKATNMPSMHCAMAAAGFRMAGVPLGFAVAQKVGAVSAVG
jgi:hypothetical protein